MDTITANGGENPEVVIRAEGLGKVYRLYSRPQDRLKELVFRRHTLGQDFWAVRDLDLEIRRGETVGIIGRNGSGKSTLLQMVCGTLQPSAGALEVHGRVAALLELGAGFNPEFTGRENVHLSASVLGLSEAQIAERFPLIEAFAEIGGFIDQPVRQYSSGMYARLAFAVCAHVDADILVVDEILAVGDTGFQQRCMRFLNGFRARGTLLFVSHDEGAVMALCDRAVWLDRGVPRAIGPSKDVCQEYRSFQAGNHDPDGVFQTGGATAASAATTDIEAPALKPFDFDFDHDWVRAEKPMIERAVIAGADGQTIDFAEGGAEIAVQIDLIAARELRGPVVAFVLRNRLGQVILRDDTAATKAPERIPVGRRFHATFRFCLPNLPSGDYLIEPLLFEEGHAAPIDRLMDALFLHVDSHPYLGGLANAPMLRKRLVAAEGSVPRVLVSTDFPARVISDERWRDRNPMEISPFNPDGPWFGHGGAKVVDCGFFGPDGKRLAQIQGGSRVELVVRTLAERRLPQPIVGFVLRNSLGQNIFGDNSFIGAPETDRLIEKGGAVTGYFDFQMPFLPVGIYSIVPSIADGTQLNHVPLHWIEEATRIRITASPIDRTIVGVPMIEVGLELTPLDANHHAA